MKVTFVTDRMIDLPFNSKFTNDRTCLNEPEKRSHMKCLRFYDLSHFTPSHTISLFEFFESIYLHVIIPFSAYPRND